MGDGDVVGWLGLSALMVFRLLLLLRLPLLARAFNVHISSTPLIMDLSGMLPSSSLPPRDKRGWAGGRARAGWVDLATASGTGAQEAGRQGDERGEYFVHVKGAELKAGIARGERRGQRRAGGTRKGGTWERGRERGKVFDGDETRHNN